MSSAQHRAAVYPSLTNRMCFVYLLALFDAFMSDVFEAVLTNRQAMMKSSKKQITLEVLLDFASFEDLHWHLAKRELNELGYKSLRDQLAYYEERFNVALGGSSVPLDTLVEQRAARMSWFMLTVS